MLGFLFGKGKSKNISISSDGGISVISDSSNGRVNIEGKNNLSNNSISIGRNCSVNGTVFYSNSDEEININNDDGYKFDLEFNGKKYSDCVNVKIIIDGIEHNEKISRKNYAKAFGGLPIKIDVKGNVKSLSTTNGSVSVSGDSERIDTTNGSVEVNGNSGDINTSNGSVGVGGDAKSVKTTNGNVRVRNISGSCETRSGDIDADKIEGSCNTRSGNIRGR